MHVDDCYQLGYITKPHGLNGIVGVVLDVDDPLKYNKLESVFVEINTRLIPFFVESISIHKNKATVKFEDVDSIESAEALRGKSLYLPLELLPPLEGDNFYYHEIIDFKVVDHTHGEIGNVTTVYSIPGQDLIACNYKGKEVLIPVNDEIILKINKETAMLEVDLPEGLLEIYLE